MAAYAISGAGFGLYGYLPALLDGQAETALLPEKYRGAFLARTELAEYAPRVRWVRDWAEAVAAADGAVIASTPERQLELARDCLRAGNVRRLFLEKPLAPEPQAARALLDALIASGRKFRIGYSFLHADWYESLKRGAGRVDGDLSLTWRFKAHHFAEGLANWKRAAAAGGGALRFYGIQVLALLASLGYDDVLESSAYEARPGEPERWRAAFAGPSLPACRVELDSRSDAGEFSITAPGGGIELRLAEPFEPAAGASDASLADRRIGVLRRLCGTIELADAPFHRFYASVNALWEKAEAATSPVRNA